MPRPDPTFVTHLIATAEHAPQTRSLRRASPADAQTAYSASQARRHAPASGRGRSSRTASRCELERAALSGDGCDAIAGLQIPVTGLPARPRRA